MFRCLFVWLCATAAAGLVVAWAMPDLTGGPGGRSFEGAVVGVAAAALVGCAAWGWAAASVVICQALTGRVGPGPRGVPRWLRRAVLLACGLAVVGAGATAHAAHADEDTARARADRGQVLAGLPMPDRTVGSVRPAPAPGAARSHVVHPGDTLWDIAAAELGAGPRWPRIHRLNRAVIGADPDLIHPGQELRLPVRAPDRREEPR